MKTPLSKGALVLLVILLAVALLLTVTHLWPQATSEPIPKPHLPMMPSGSPELMAVMNKVDAIDGVRVMTANHTASDNAFRASGLADTREKISEYLGALERVGLRNYVLEVQDAPTDAAPGVSFVITGKLTIK